MRILLDTCTFLWLVLDDPRLSLLAREVFKAPENDIYLSSVSAWEISVKYALGRLALPETPERFLPAQRERHGIEAHSLSEDAALYLPRLPALHRDPFDRILICQAIVESLALLTPDECISQYPVRCLW